MLLEFKGIALFTPGGDVIYAIDSNKQGRWHQHLCVAVQDIWGLPEPPYFLVPSFTATLDRWFNPQTQQLQTYAELHPPIQPYTVFLNAIFETPEQPWEVIPWYRSTGDPLLVDQYRELFAVLWEPRGLIVSYQEWEAQTAKTPIAKTWEFPAHEEKTQTAKNYIFKLFISGTSRTTESHLQQLHQLLEEHLPLPYQLKIIDTAKAPELAELDQISATPTLIRVQPGPTRRIVGTFEDPAQLLELLLGM